jgi:pimeloyl-ACP methyl ester carboxylesterase
MDGMPHPESIRVNGTDLTYVEEGEGDAVVFVHGTLGDYRAWIDMLPAFAPHYRTVFYSRRRHWPNAWPDDDSGCEAPVHAADLAALIEALDLAPAHLIGHSYGALPSLLLAAEQPHLVRTLVLGEPPLMSWLNTLPEGQPLVADFMTSAVAPCRDAFAQGEGEAAVRAFIDGVIGAGAFDQLPAEIRAEMMDNAPELDLHVGAGESTWPPFFCDDAGNVRVPTLLLSGELSPPMFEPITEELARCLPLVERATIPGVSHDLWDPPVFTATVLAFLARY